ncbi:PRKC apoptosis WT1 regulator protein [Kryptolebias marmoratus]|uniref:PRKC, apoptosis, WT1, regulator n=1 Tax=Kryptolebias marmoratus TaxID=37003 RepID=A0A3Q3AJR2_KRYMA|nr:PRKC apoptosis WT1 regulator protein [Kryptolebias marmoratus]
MATGGFKPNATANFLEEWKAKREKVRAKMLGDIAAAAGVPLSPTSNPPDLSASPGGCRAPSQSVARSSSGGALNRTEEDGHHPVHTPAGTPKKAPSQTDKAPAASPDCSPRMACNDSDKSPPPSSKGKEKKSSGPSARKGKGQIEKRKLREKRRSTGVVSIPSNESLDELDDDDDAAEKDRRDEEELVQANTFQNESMTADPSTDYLLETPRSGSGRHMSSAGHGSEEEAGGKSRQRHNRHGRDGGAGSLERRLEELEMELARELQENARLLKAQQDKDDLIVKLKGEIDMLNRDLDDIEDENEQLKQENKTLLKVVSQLTR